ncbi:tetratricopeptide repeat protein [Limnobacter litoralis]|uniref:protein O-GlcNAc transferase n=1 Tax=Limnobacter litoralis TaxID=481366 RepID=A0ABQ5YX70_9BURK|nr:tetratricopeptide repeat protein [Limnobacter litoralis]GLR27334.1 hypothetical protein GCM10007875_24250 [Limnobacter litoralis]
MGQCESLQTIEEIKRYAAKAPAEERLIRRAFETLLEQNQQDVKVWLAYAEYLISTGVHGRALHCLMNALKQAGESFEIYFYLGVCYKSLEKTLEALGAWDKALSLNPDNSVCLNNLGWTLVQEGQVQKGLSLLERAVELSPGYLSALHNLIEALRRSKNLDSAVQRQLELIRLEENAANYVRLANLFMEQAQLEKARQILLTVLPNFASDALVHNALGGVYYKYGELDSARQCFQKAAELNSGFASAIGNYLLCLNYSELPPEQVFQAHTKYGGALGDADFPGNADAPNAPKALRVGIVSPDFYQHPVGQLFEPVLLQLADSSKVDVTLYHVSAENDDITRRLKTAYGDRFEFCSALSDELLLKKIRSDQQDVLIDLTGHTSGHRLPVFARRAAPIQASYLGYPNTTGVRAMDFRIVDEFTDPAPEADGLASERLIRMPAPFLNLTAPRLKVDVTPLPSLNSDGFVFGCFNNLAKLSDSTIQTWAAVLLGLPHARLILKAGSFADGEIKRYQLARIARLGLPVDRVELHARMGFADHLALYGQVDLCLDPFPYNGTATSIEALWMGVPFVTLTGQSHVARVGTSLCKSLGLDDFVATDRVQYVQRCLWWASHKRLLNQVRLGMRDRIVESGAGDAKLSARKFEDAMVQMVDVKRGLN